MRRRFFLPPEVTALSLLVTPGVDVAERSMLAVWDLDRADARELELPGLAWSNSVDGWFQYVPSALAGTETAGPWVAVPTVGTVVVELRSWPDRASVAPKAIGSVAMRARVNGSTLVAVTLGEPA